MRLFYLNALFDLHLGDYPVAKFASAASEMATLFAFMGNEGDRCLLDVEIPADFIQYLCSINVKIRKPFDKNSDENPVAVPWGWDCHSYKRLRDLNAVCINPDPDIVKEVNSRKFLGSIAGEYDLGVPGSVYCDSPDSYLENLKKIGSETLVMKPSFGNSGYGFSIISNRERERLHYKENELFVRHGGLIIEPWCKRICDFSSSVNIGKDGQIGPIRHQRLLSNSFGAFVGIILTPEDSVPQKYVSIQEKAVKRAAGALFSRGYFGPAGFDSFTYVDNGGNEKIAPVIEINARYSMSDVAHAIRDRYAPDKWCFFRLAGKKKCIFPDDYDRWTDLVKQDHFDPVSREGILLVTPLRLKKDGALVQPSRNGVFISADSEAELFRIDERLRNVLNRDRYGSR